jgi:GT2 family glycosyltransferase
MTNSHTWPNSLDRSVSVVIPTYNRIGSLRNVLPSYLASSSVLEVIIVDDASRADVGQQLRELVSADPRLRYLRNRSNLGLPASRNEGVLQAQGTWILQSEDDLVLGVGCIETLLEHATSMNADIIAGRRIWMRIGESEAEALARADNSRRPYFNERLLEINSHATTSSDSETALLNATMLIRRGVFETVSYDPFFGRSSSWREDSDFQLAALESGHRIVFCPHAVSFHHSRASQSFGPNRFGRTITYAKGVFENNLYFLRKHHTFLSAHFPKSLILQSPILTALVYGVYRGAWLVMTEVVRSWRMRRSRALVWE